MSTRKKRKDLFEIHARLLLKLLIVKMASKDGGCSHGTSNLSCKARVVLTTTGVLMYRGLKDEIKSTIEYIMYKRFGFAAYLSSITDDM